MLLGAVSYSNAFITHFNQEDPQNLFPEVLFGFDLPYYFQFRFLCHGINLSLLKDWIRRPVLSQKLSETDSAESEGYVRAERAQKLSPQTPEVISSLPLDLSHTPNGVPYPQNRSVVLLA